MENFLLYNNFLVWPITGSNPADIHRFRSHTGKLAIVALLMGGTTVLVYYYYIFVIVALHRTKLHALQKNPCQKSVANMRRLAQIFGDSIYGAKKVCIQSNFDSEAFLS